MGGVHRLFMAAAVVLAALVAVAGSAAAPAPAPSPWTAPAAVADAPAALPLVAFTGSGAGLIAWATRTGGALPGLVTSGARILAASDISSAAGLRANFGVQQMFGYGRDRLLLGGSTLTSGGKRAAVSTGTIAGPLKPAVALPAPGAASQLVALALEPTGSAAAVVSACTGPGPGCPAHRLYLLTRRRGGSFGHALLLDRSRLTGGGVADSAGVAINPHGEVLVAWESNGAIRARAVSPRGRAGRVSRIGPGKQARVRVSLSPGGLAVVAWTSRPIVTGKTPGGFISYAAVQRAGQVFGPPQQLADLRSAGPSVGAGVQIMRFERRTTVAYTAPGKHLAVRARDVVDAAAGKSPFGAPQLLSGVDRDAVLGDVAVGPDGEQVIIWITGHRGPGSDPAAGPPGLQAATRAADVPLFSPPEDVAAGAIDEARVSIDPFLGRPWATWRPATGNISYAIRGPVG